MLTNFAFLMLMLGIGIWIIHASRRRLFSEPDSLLEDIQAFAGVDFTAEEKKAVSVQVRGRRRLA